VKVKINAAALGRSKWYEYVIRFIFGGTITALTGIIAKRWGPGVGGLFLAFPAILPAAATLIEKHEKQKKKRAGVEGTHRARATAGVDAAGAAMGTIGLMVFAVIVWRGMPTYPAPLVLGLATVAWLAVVITAWGFHETIWRRLRVAWMGNVKHSTEGRRAATVVRNGRFNEQERNR
jgi:hypothetical protein